MVNYLNQNQSYEKNNDFDMGGLEVAKIVSTEYPQTKSIIFSMHNNQEYMVRSVENGAMGYLLKDTTKV